jgi:hypothetical protein
MLGATFFLRQEIFKRQHHFFKREYFVTIFFKKVFAKKHKLIFKENIGIVITTIAYNFEKTSENVSLEHSIIIFSPSYMYGENEKKKR